MVKIEKSTRSDRKGRRNERRAKKGFDLLREQEKITAHWHNETLDITDATDRVIQMPDGEERAIQIKSSPAGANKHKMKHPHIPVIVVEKGDDTQRIAHKIETALRKRWLTD